MSLKIRTVLPLIISSLALLLVVSAGFTAYDAMGRRQDTEAFLKVNQTSQLLLQSAGQWAIERGMTNAPIKSSDTLSPERRAEIIKVRASADQAFRDAVQHLSTIPAMKAGAKDIADAERVFREFESFRAKVDENLAKPGAERTPEIVQGFSPAATNLILVAGNRLRLALETLSRPPSVTLAQLVGLRHLTAQMAENAGRERTLLGGIIGARSKLTTEDIRSASGFRGQIDLAWETIVPIRQRADTPAKIIAAIAGVESEYFGKYGEVHDAVFATSNTGEYKISGSEYVARATTAINSILHLADEMGNASNNEANDEASRSTSSLALNMAMLFAGVALAAISFWIAFRRILGPLNAMTGTMTRLAEGDKTVDIPSLERTDEIGEMASAVQVFKDNMIETERLRAEQSETEQRQAQQRKADMIKLADDFESAVGEIVETVSSASTELEASASTLTSTAVRSQELTTVVAAASEEASTNVQSAASATEELTSSVNEIGHQVQESARMANEAVDQARKTNDRVSELSQAASRRRGRTDQHHRRADQSAGAQCDHRGRPRRRSRPRFRGRGVRGQGAGRANGKSDRRDRSADHRHPVRDSGVGERDQGDQRHHRKIIRDLLDHRSCGGRRGCGDAGDFPQRAAGSPGHPAGLVPHHRRAARRQRDRLGLVAGSLGGAVAVRRLQPAQARSRQVPQLGEGGMKIGGSGPDGAGVRSRS